MINVSLNASLAVYRREMLILRRRFKRQVLGQAITPLLYLVTFGYAMGGELQFGDTSYLKFLLPGLVAMSSMTQAFAISTDINVARFYWHIFDEFQAAPISNGAYVAGEVLAGITRALMSIIIIMALGACFGIRLQCGPLYWLTLFLNSFLFASLAVALAMVVRNHADQSLLTNFVITPMAFLGGTFFPVDRLPQWVQAILHLLPLTHAATAIRSAALGKEVNILSLLLLAFLGATLFWIALHCVNRAKD
jgi:Nod factor-specific ABC transporter NodJ protein